MDKNDSVAQNISSPKPSYHARRQASSTQTDGKRPSAAPTPVHQIGGPDEDEKFDVPHLVQFF